MEIQSLLLLLSALGLGAAHALEPDHMAAVSAFVARRPSPAQAARFGVNWALGHGLSLLVLGTTLWSLKRALEANQPSLFSSGVLEKVVGVVLLMLGIWTLWQVWSGRATNAHRHGHGHDGHFHSHAQDSFVDESSTKESAEVLSSTKPHKHSHGDGHGLGSLSMGMLHGAAGTGAFVGESAIALGGSLAQVWLYTLLFSVGVLAAMAAYAGILGGIFTWSGRKSGTLLSGARVLTGAATCAIGVCLLLGVEVPGLVSPWVEH